MYMYMYVECVFSEIVCSTLCFHDFVCMHLLLDQFFDDFLKFQKLKQPYIHVHVHCTYPVPRQPSWADQLWAVPGSRAFLAESRPVLHV